MHLCLQIAEIQEQIISMSSRRTNVQLAMTCRTFHEPALNAVSASVEGYMPLIKWIFGVVSERKTSTGCQKETRIVRLVLCCSRSRAP